MDNVDAATRSRIMASVRSKNTKPEMRTRSVAHRLGYRFRLHRRDLPGCPDMAFVSRRIALFVHGCFWHGHECRRGRRTPAANAEYWRAKVARNAARDKGNLEALGSVGWTAVVIWECQTQGKALTKLLKDALG